MIVKVVKLDGSQEVSMHECNTAYYKANDRVFSETKDKSAIGISIETSIDNATKTNGCIIWVELPSIVFFMENGKTIDTVRFE